MDLTWLSVSAFERTATPGVAPNLNRLEVADWPICLFETHANTAIQTPKDLHGGGRRNPRQLLFRGSAHPNMMRF